MKKVFILFLILQSLVAVDAKVWFVSVNGRAGAQGTQEDPLLQINQAAVMALPGDTILVGEGIYRERVAPPRGGNPGLPITYMAVPGKRVIIRGSEPWSPNWEKHAEGIYSAVPEASLFNDPSPEFVDDYNPFKVNLSSTPHDRQGKREVERGWEGDSTLVYTCGQVFLDGKILLEVPFMEELEDGTWYYEPTSERIYVHFGETDPEKVQVEITTRRRIFAPYVRGLGYITVEGFVLEHCGNNYPTNFWYMTEWAQKGAMGLEAGHNWIIRKNVIRYAKTFALDCGHVDMHTKSMSAHDNLIEENYILENGSAGILSNSSLNMLIRGNVIMYNNTLGFNGKKRWEQAGIKCHNLKDGLISGNYSAENNRTYGIWLDNQFPDSRLSGNVLVNNGSSGLFLEMSDYGFDRLLVDNNIMVGNGENPVYIHDASGATFYHNLMANGPTGVDHNQAVWIRQVDPRTKTYHHSFFNNIMIGTEEILDINYPSHRGGPHRIDYNVYDAKAKERVFSINRMSDDPSPWTEAEFLALVTEDLGENAPDAASMDGDGVAHLNHKEWQVFWSAHELEIDNNSLLVKGSSVDYNATNQKLTINVGFKPEFVGSKKQKVVNFDFYGEKIPQDGTAIPGPFQNLVKGKNSFIVWDGLPILKRGELPDPVIFNNNRGR